MKVAHYFSMLKKNSIYTKYMLLLQKMSQTYLFWEPKLNAPKINLIDLGLQPNCTP